MTAFNPITSPFRHNDLANTLLLDAAGALNDAQLDQPFDIGVGTLRRTLVHILAGESVWLQRWQGRVETPWPDEREPLATAAIANRFVAVTRERDVFLTQVSHERLSAVQTYRDSKGSLFRAALGDMIVQAFAHSVHHRAQAVNMLRRLGVDPPPQVDYMMLVRQPA